jgi:hypothetical protein
MNSAPQTPPAVTLPPELLNLPRPNPHSPYQVGQPYLVVAILWILLWSGVGLWLVGDYANDLNSYNLLQSEGVVTPATITSIIDESGSDTTAYAATYRFMAGNTPIDGRDEISYDLYHSLKTGAKLNVLYAKSNPQISAIKTELAPPGHTGFTTFAAFMSFIAVLAGLAMAWFSAQSTKRASDLRTKGKIVRGVVFDKWVRSGSENDYYCVAYAYKVPENKTEIFCDAIQSDKAYNSLNKGDRISVRYLPETPQISSLDGKW